MAPRKRAPQARDADAVRAVLQRLQDAYSARDVTQAQAVVEALFVPDDDLLFIAAEPDGWERGPAQVQALLARDWRYWGAVVFDVADATITVRGDVAIAAAQGTVSTAQGEDPAPEVYGGDLPLSASLESLMWQVTDGLFDPQQDDTHTTWPLRLTAVLVRREGRWMFQHMHVSYPTLRPSDTQESEAV